jgi:hypothetical protein
MSDATDRILLGRTRLVDAYSQQHESDAEAARPTRRTSSDPIRSRSPSPKPHGGFPLVSPPSGP